MSKQQLFQVANHHGESCGIPPLIDEQTFPGVYRGYFENQYGEQTILLALTCSRGGVAAVERLQDDELRCILLPWGGGYTCAGCNTLKTQGE